MNRLRPFFSYYGAKWRAAKFYPPPQYDCIVEPFAGSACYALTYPKRRVVLVDKDPSIAGIWRWLISAKEEDVAALPDEVDKVDDVDACDEAKALIGFWLVKGSAQPVGKKYAWAASGDWDNQFWGPAIKKRIIGQMPRIRHWRVMCGDYSEVEVDGPATWFVDPPYQVAGKHYRFNGIDYEALAEWCRSRAGQVIVCEQEGAQWMPFESFGTFKSLKSRKASEVVFIQGPGRQGKFF